MLDQDELEILKRIDEKVVVYPHEVADALWPKDPQRNLRVGTKIKALEAGGYVVRRGDKKHYVVSTKKGEVAVRDAKRAAIPALFDEGDGAQ